MVSPAGAKLAAVSVTATTCPGPPIEGAIEVSVGAELGLTVSVTGIETGELAADPT